MRFLLYTAIFFTFVGAMLSLSNEYHVTFQREYPGKEVSSTTTLAIQIPSEKPLEEPATPPTPVPEKESVPIVENKIESLPPPYPFPQKNPEEQNTETRAALVNIFCSSEGGRVAPISGSGIIIDPRGIILTNAHVAQYVLLGLRPDVNLSCVVRSGSPAQAKWLADILYIPPTWVEKHAHEINMRKPQSTGEHDFALLRIAQSADGTPLPETFPFLSPETRGAVTVPGDEVFIAAYPAEFSGGSATQTSLSALSVFTTVKQLLTFFDNTIDVLALGGIPLAQSGSSGGAVVNRWGKLVGVIATTSEGGTTAERNLRAITLSHINRALLENRGEDLEALLKADVAQKTRDFMANDAPRLAQMIVNHLGN